MSVSIWTGESTLEDFNVANASFVTIMQEVLGTDVRDASGSLCGSLEGMALLALQERVHISLNALRATEQMEEMMEGILMIFNEDGSFRKGYLIRWLSSLLAVIEEAIESGYPLRWA